MLTVGSLCTGYGGLDLAASMTLGPLDHRWHAENDPAAAAILAEHWPGVPNLGDIRTIDFTRVDPVDVLVAGYPCQGESMAGRRRGTDDERWLGDVVTDAVRMVGPRLVLLENVAGHLSMGFGRVLGNLAQSGYVGSWLCLPASDVGAPHRRERVFIVAYPAGTEPPRPATPTPVGQVPAAEAAGRVTLLPAPAAHDELGLLPTPAAADSDRTSSTYPRGNPTLTGALLPTPNARDYKGADRRGERPDGAQRTDAQHSLPRVVDLLPTPRATDGTKGGPNQRGSSGDLMLPSAVVHLLPTPVAMDAESARNATANRTRPGTASNGWTLSDIAHADRWGRYTAAITRWETITGRPAPDPTEPGTRGQPRLSPTFVEWMMGLPAGWVVGRATRNATLRILGNGVVPAQGAHAYTALLDRVPRP